MKKLKLITYTMIILVLGACKKDKEQVDVPEPIENDTELITTVTLHFTEVGNTSNHFMASFKDVDGVGGEDATIDTIKLDTNTTYNVNIELLDESKSPSEDITAEVEDEADQHLFCYEPTSSTITINITDTDGNYPLGIESDWITTDAVFTNILLKLKHQPNGIKDGTCSPGETDVEVDFPLVIN